MADRKITQRGKSFRVNVGPTAAFWDQVERGAWEPDTFVLFDKFIDKKHSYIDIGCWIGPTLLYGCQIANRAYGIEPDPVAFAELAANIDRNKPLTDNVNLFNVCITPQSGRTVLGNRGIGGDSMSSVLYGDCPTAWTVEGLSFEDFIKQNGIAECNFIKMDIEGGEYAVLPTMLSYLKRHRPTLCVSLHPSFTIGFKHSNILHWIIRRVLSLAGTLRILRSLNFYKHVYDSGGKEINVFRVLLLSRPTLTLVATDAEWVVGEASNIPRGR